MKGPGSAPAARPGTLRATVAQALAACLVHHRSLTELTADTGPLADLGGRDGAFARAALYGSVRWYRLLEAWLEPRLKRPLKARDADLEMLLLAGIHELSFMQTPAHAAVNEHVAACTVLGKAWAKGLTNAILRGFAGRDAPGTDNLPRGVATAHPDWLVRRLDAAWGDAAAALLAANNRQAPMTLRVNRARTGVAEVETRLEATGLACTRGRHAPAALTLATPRPVTDIPGFAEGLVSVQDEAAQLVASFAAGWRPERVLDACAAPGGKTGALLEVLEAGTELVALDADPARASRIEENLARLGLTAEVRVGDVRDPASWWDGRPFDLIVADVPCSATGVIRRHPDIKWLRRDDDIAALAATQGEIVCALWPLLKRNAMLVYVTCSVLPEENDAVVGRAAEQAAAGRVLSVAQALHQRGTPWGVPRWGRATAYGRQILTGEDGMDGFYYAVLGKSDDAAAPGR